MDNTKIKGEQEMLEYGTMGISYSGIRDTQSVPEYARRESLNSYLRCPREACWRKVMGLTLAILCLCLMCAILLVLYYAFKNSG